MDRLPTRVNRADPEFSERKSFNLELIETLRERLDVASMGGGGKYVDRHRSRGKLWLGSEMSESSTPARPSLNCHH